MNKFYIFSGQAWYYTLDINEMTQNGYKNTLKYKNTNGKCIQP